MTDVDMCNAMQRLLELLDVVICTLLSSSLVAVSCRQLQAVPVVTMAAGKQALVAGGASSHFRC